MNIPKLVYSFLFLCLYPMFSQGQEAQTRSTFFWSSEVMIGKVLAVHSNFPETDPASTISISLGRLQHNPEKAWTSFFRSPETGVSAVFTQLGNNDVFGYSFNLFPYLSFSPFKDQQQRWRFKMGLGASYYSKSFDQVDNPNNKSVGSNIAWAFQLSFYRKLRVRPRSNWQLGISAFHSSNGHTQLPNFGMNVFSLSLLAQFFPQAPPSITSRPEVTERPSSKNALIIRTGFGFHELGGTDRPIGGPDKGIYSLAIHYAWYLRPFIRLRAGLTYRYYQSFHDYIVDNNLAEFINSPDKNASNLFASAGLEFLLDHVGMDLEIGVNLYKPFFEEFYDTFEDRSSFDKTTKKILATRMGLHLYLLNTSHHPKNNLFLGAHINANYGQADFTGFSLGYVRNL